MLQTLREMPTPTRADLEAAANAFFLRLLEQEDGERDPDERIIEEDLAEYERRVGDLERQFRQNRFDKRVERDAERLVRQAGGNLADLDEASRRYALQLSARVTMEWVRFLVHVHRTPGVPFPAQRIAGILSAAALSEYVAPSFVPPAGPAASVASSSRTVRDAVRLYMDRKRRERLGTSHLEEIGRAFEWVVEHVGGDTSIDRVTADQMREFRDGLERLDTRFRGVRSPFADRQTRDPEFQINPRTAGKYWSSVMAFFFWCAAELGTGQNPTLGIKALRPRNVAKRTPPPFTDAELQRLFRTPVYAGHKSEHFLLSPGTVLAKGSHWWSGLIALHTGMRAGEIAQLQIADFDFHADVPVIHVRVEGEESTRPKKLKSAAAERDVPISPVLIELGLEAFVAARAKGIGKPRVFPDLQFGLGDRRSDGLTKFWGRLLHQNGLHAPGRATHVLRHTAVAALRRARVPEEVIGGLVGHAPGTQTGAYGGAFPIKILAEAVQKIDYGFDIVAMLTANEATLAGTDARSRNRSGHL